MRLTLFVSGLMMMAAACDGGSYDYAGHNTDDYFALDGERSWKYRQEDLDVEWRMEASKSGTVSKGNTEVVTIDYSVLDPAELLYSIDWSSDSSGGILVHGYSVEDGETVAFDEPVGMADSPMKPGELVETITNGMTYTSELVGVETCANDWVTEPWDCLHFTVSDGVDDDTSAPFVGDWWIAADWGTSRFQPAGYDTPWILSEALWSPTED
ncbi:MAG: hypothetical protein P8R54_09210 [Myxococcota bacterium]|nr:hypothetical protein [Myxococcota bacterium]